MKELLLKAVELPVAERYRLAFLIAESLGCELKKPCPICIAEGFGGLDEGCDHTVTERLTVPADPEVLEIERLRAFVGWVDTWVSNPASAYSVNATEGLFGMARDKIAALSRS